MEVNSGLTDSAYEVAAAEAEVKTTTTLYVKRGSVYADVRKVQVKPAEHVFMRRPTGAYESIGIVDSEGQLPPEEITP